VGEGGEEVGGFAGASPHCGSRRVGKAKRAHHLCNYVRLQYSISCRDMFEPKVIFTVVVAQRPSSLLVEEVDRLSASIKPFSDDTRSRQSRSASCPIIFTRFGLCRTAIQTFPGDGPDQEWIFARPRSASQINEQGRQ